MRVPISARSVAAVLLAILAAGVTVVIVSDDGGGHTRTVTIHVGAAPAPQAVSVDNADPGTARDDKLQLSTAAKTVYRAASAAPAAYDFGGDLRGHDPTQAGVVRGPLAAQEWPGCKTAFVRTFSQRTSSIKAIALHYTAGLNIAGWGDIDGLTAFSNNPRNQVSWAFSVDREGHCAYNVPITQKAWTIAGLNSQTVNLEIVGTGREPDYAGPGIKRVAAIVARIGRIEHIPLTLGATDGHCNVTRAGIITHWMGGPCSGGHIDIKPYDIVKVIAQIRALAGAQTTKAISAHTAQVCRKYAWYGPPGPVSAARHGAQSRARHGERHRYLTRNHIACSLKGVATRR
jgi:hypothetical protein